MANEATAVRMVMPRLALDVVRVGLGGAVVHPAETADDAVVEQDALGEAGLARIDMSENPDIDGSHVADFHSVLARKGGGRRRSSGSEPRVFSTSASEVNSDSSPAGVAVNAEIGLKSSSSHDYHPALRRPPATRMPFILAFVREADIILHST